MEPGALVIAFWIYGYVAAYFTHSLWLALGIAALLWWMNAVIVLDGASGADLRGRVKFFGTDLSLVNDSTTLAFEVLDVSSERLVTLNLLIPLSLVLGTIVGVTVAWAFQLTRLLDIEPWHVRRRLSVTLAVQFVESEWLPVWIFNFSMTRLIVGIILTLLAFDFLLGRFEPELSRSASLAIGIALIVVGVSLVFYTLFRWFKSDRPHDWLTYGYAWALLLFLFLPSIYIVLPTVAGGILFLILLSILTGVVLFRSFAFFANLSDEARVALLTHDIRYSPTDAQPWAQTTRWLAFFLPLSVLFIAGWLRDVSLDALVDERTRVVQVLIVVAAVTLVLETVLLVLGCVRWQQHAARWFTEEDHRDGQIVVSREHAQSAAASTHAYTPPTLTHRSGIIATGAPAMPQYTPSAAEMAHSIDAFRVKRT